MSTIKENTNKRLLQYLYLCITSCNMYHHNTIEKKVMTFNSPELCTCIFWLCTSFMQKPGAA